MCPDIHIKKRRRWGQVYFQSMGTPQTLAPCLLWPRCPPTSAGPQPQRHEQVEPGHLQEQNSEPDHGQVLEVQVYVCKTKRPMWL